MRRARGHHRWHRPPASANPAPGRQQHVPGVRVEAEAGDLTVDELRGFLADVDEAAEAAGIKPGGLRPWAATRMSGAMKFIGVTIRRHK